MRLSLVIALVLAGLGLGCAKKKVAEDPVAKVCRHIVEVCGKNANFDMCVASAKAMRENNLEAAQEAELCVLQQKSCQDASRCTMKAGKKIIRTSLRNAKQAVEKVKEELAPAASSSPAEPAPPK